MVKAKKKATPGRVLTLATLQRKGACTLSRIRFEHLFGKSVVVTPEQAARHAHMFDELDVYWLVNNLLRKKSSRETVWRIRERYYRDWAAYRRARMRKWARQYIAEGRK